MTARECSPAGYRTDGYNNIRYERVAHDVRENNEWVKTRGDPSTIRAYNTWLRRKYYVDDARSAKIFYFRTRRVERI